MNLKIKLLKKESRVDQVENKLRFFISRNSFKPRQCGSEEIKKLKGVGKTAACIRLGFDHFSNLYPTISLGRFL